LIPGAINNECVGFSIIEIEKLCKESTECKAEQAYVRNQKPVPVIPVDGSNVFVKNHEEVCTVMRK